MAIDGRASPAFDLTGTASVSPSSSLVTAAFTTRAINVQPPAFTPLPSRQGKQNGGAAIEFSNGIEDKRYGYVGEE
jgi:hypothetical protein